MAELSEMRAEITTQFAYCFRYSIQPQGCLRDHSECAFRSNKQVCQVIASRSFPENGASQFLTHTDNEKATQLMEATKGALLRNSTTLAKKTTHHTKQFIYSQNRRSIFDQLSLLLTNKPRCCCCQHTSMHQCRASSIPGPSLDSGRVYHFPRG